MGESDEDGCGDGMDDWEQNLRCNEVFGKLEEGVDLTSVRPRDRQGEKVSSCPFQEPVTSFRSSRPSRLIFITSKFMLLKCIVISSASKTSIDCERANAHSSSLKPASTVSLACHRVQSLGFPCSSELQICQFSRATTIAQFHNSNAQHNRCGRSLVSDDATGKKKKNCSTFRIKIFFKMRHEAF